MYFDSLVLSHAFHTCVCEFFSFLMTLRSRDFYPKCIKSLSFVLQCKWDSFLILLRTFRCIEVAQNLNCSTHRWISWMHIVQLIYNRVAVKNCFHSFSEIYTTKLYSHIEQALIQSHVSSKLVIMTTTNNIDCIHGKRFCCMRVYDQHSEFYILFLFFLSRIVIMLVCEAKKS